MTEEKMWILERFGDSDMQDAIAEIRRLKAIIGEIVILANHLYPEKEAENG